MSKRRSTSHWSAQENEKLTQNYLVLKQSKLQALFPDRTWMAIRKQANKIGIPTRKGLGLHDRRIFDETSEHKSWTEEEDMILKSLYEKMSTKEIAKKLPTRTIRAVSGRISTLKLVDHSKDTRSYGKKSLFTKEESIQRSRDRNRIFLQKLRRTDPTYSMHNNAKHRAKVQGLEFTITKDDIIIPDNCPIFGFPLKQGEGITEIYSPSLDRKDPSKGYTKDNIWVISHKANRLKNNASQEDLEKLLSALRLHL